MVDTPSYKVVWLSQTRAAVRESRRKALQAGHASEFAHAVKELDKRLCSNPLDVGEIYRSRGNVEEYLAIQELLSIDFAVDKKRKLVLVRIFKGRF